VPRGSPLVSFPRPTSNVSPSASSRRNNYWSRTRVRFIVRLSGSASPSRRAHGRDDSDRQDASSSQAHH
jgi:hypothetical protein